MRAWQVPGPGAPKDVLTLAGYPTPGPARPRSWSRRSPRRLNSDRRPAPGLHWALHDPRDPRDPALPRRAHAPGRHRCRRPIVSERIGLGDVPAGPQHLVGGTTTGRVVMVS